MEAFEADARSTFGSGFETVVTQITEFIPYSWYRITDGTIVNSNGFDIPLDTDVYLVTCKTDKEVYIVDWADVNDPRINK